MQKKRRLRRKGGGVYLFPLRSDSTELHPADLVLHAIEQKGPVNLRRVRRELNDERRGIPPRRFRLGIRADAANDFFDLPIRGKVGTIACIFREHYMSAAKPCEPEHDHFFLG